MWKLMSKQQIVLLNDGAANMMKAYNGLQARISTDNPNLVYIHCMAHVFNLVIANLLENSSIDENLYGSI